MANGTPEPRIERPGMIREERAEHGLSRLVAQELRSGLLLFTASGRLTRTLGRRITDFLDATEVDRYLAFQDWWDVASYESSARYDLTQWVRANRERMVEGHILARSKLVKMGVTVANITVLGHLVLHEEKAPFARALAQARAQRSPGMRRSP